MISNEWPRPSTEFSIKEEMFLKTAEEIARLVLEKNRAYGDSFSKTGEFLRLCYPDGVNPTEYDDMLTIVRIFDKLMRIATNKDALGESPWQDVNGYSLLAIVADNLKSKRKKE